jgi:hypothetical protein
LTLGREPIEGYSRGGQRLSAASVEGTASVNRDPEALSFVDSCPKPGNGFRLDGERPALCLPVVMQFLLGDDLVLDLVVGGLGHHLLLYELVRALVRSCPPRCRTGSRDARRQSPGRPRPEVVKVAVLYALIGLFHWLCRRPFFLISADSDSAYQQGWACSAVGLLFTPRSASS